MKPLETPARETSRSATGSGPNVRRVASDQRLLAELRGRARRRLPPGAFAGVMSFVGSAASEARS